MTTDSQVCFHRRLFGYSVKPGWCITAPVELLMSTNRGYQAAANHRLDLSCGLCTSLSLTENTAPLSVA